MKFSIRYLSLLFTALAGFALPPAAGAAPTAVPIVGEIERLTLNEPANFYSGGVMVVGGVEVILPKNLLIDLPANRLTLQQIFAQAPAACIANGESGLAKSDKCSSSGTGGFATLSAVNSTNGNVIAGDVLIDKATESLTGKISYIDYNQGYFRVNGDPNSASTGVMVRLNDPTGRHTLQSGAGCAAGPNCSPDPRFTLDPDNYTNTFATGYPLCIPSAVSRSFPGLPAITGIAAIAPQNTQAAAGGTGDLLCPSTNRTPGVVLEPAVADSRRFAPILVGDSITAEGNFETINGTRFLSAHTTQVAKALGTRNDPDQPDYLFLAEVFIEAPAFQNQRQRAMWIGFTTLAPTDVDMWSIHRDPATNAIHEFPLASVRGCDNASGVGTCSSQGLVDAGANIFRIRYDVDFLMAQSGFPSGTKDGKLSPCDHLRATSAQTPNRFAPLNICGSGINLANQFGILSPIPHEIQTRTGHLLDNPGLAGKTIDVSGNVATNGQYLYPLGMNLGGIEVAEMNEIDLNALATPSVFEGVPWNLDRRLGPGGCLNGGCESDALGSYALDPFPYSGLDPRTQANFLTGGLAGGLPVTAFSDTNFTASALSNASNRIFSYVKGTPFTGGSYNFDGNNTLLPYALGSFPADPGPIAINTTPFLSIFPPVAGDDAASTPAGVPVTIDVLANDAPVLGTIAINGVQIASAPASGSAVVNPSGTITFTPGLASAGTVSFSYTVANNFGAVSAPATVSVTILAPPTAVADTASAGVGSPVTINLTANDISGSGVLNLASVLIVSAPTCGTLVNQLDGIVVFTAPGTIPGTGNCSFSYLVSDASTPPVSSNTATVTVTITAANPPPVATNDTATAIAGSTITIPVIANDSASAGINPASVVVDLASAGTATANPNGTVSYAAPATPGSYFFAYTVQDNLVPPQTSNAALVAVTVTAAGAAPVAVNDAATAVVGTPVTISVLTNDTGTINPASVVVSVLPANGTVLANANGTVTYTPPAVAGNYAFSYTVNNNATPPATSNSASVTVAVSALPTPPVAANDTANVAFNTPATVNVLANDTAGSNPVNAASVVITAQPANGTAVANPNGTVTYTPALNFSGSNSFSYTVNDSTGLTSNAATVTLNVAGAVVEAIAVTRAQFTLNSTSWRVDGTVTPAPAPGSTTVTIFNNPTVGTAPLITTVPVANNGSWTWSSPNGSPAPNALRRISVQSNQNAATKRENVTVTVR